MRICTVSGVRVQCSPLVLLLIPVLLCLDAGAELVMVLFSLTLHELCHAIAARSLGYRVASVELHPFGFAATMDTPPLTELDELCIAAAGPVASLAAATAATAACHYFPGHTTALKGFIDINMTLAVVNLLPALPLDGGRAARALLSGLLGGGRATALCAGFGMFAGAAMLAAGVWSLIKYGANLTLAVMGAFLAIAAAKEAARSRSARLSAMVKRSAALRRGESIGVKYMAMSTDAGVGDALRRISTGKYNVILVVDSALRAVGRLDEGALMDAVARGGAGRSLGELVHGASTARIDRSERW